MTESEFVRSIFEEIAKGSTTVKQAQRLNALGVPSVRRYTNGRVYEAGRRWTPARINSVIHSPTYIGMHVLRSRYGAIEVKVPALVSSEIAEVVHALLRRRRSRPTTSDQRRKYALRGLIQCTDCGRGFVGCTNRSKGVERRYYRCAGSLLTVEFDPQKRCAAKMIPADWLEDLIGPSVEGVERISVRTSRGGGGRKSATLTINYLDGTTRTEQVERRAH